jgi:hypothetical protein
MSTQVKLIAVILALLVSIPAAAGPDSPPETGELNFHRNHLNDEVVAYLKWVVKTYPHIARLHTIGKSYLGKDLLVLEITHQKNGKPAEKPGFWIDGNLHASEVMGAEVCLKQIDTMVRQYGKDPAITHIVDTRTTYIMPKLNPDGSDHYLTKPDGMRSSVRPYDDDGDGLFDEDPPEDLNGDGHITQMRVRDETGPWKTSPDDPRLLVRAKEDEKGEWRVYSEGIDNDGDGRFNEDGVGGLDINRNWPAQWQQDYLQPRGGLYPLSEPETRAVADFLLSHPNITGVVNHHMAGNFLYRPPSNRIFNPVTGEEEFFPPEDEAVYQVFGNKYSELINKQPVRKVFGRGGPPRHGAIWGVMMDWAYYHYGVISWVPEMGSLHHFCDDDGDGQVTDLERLRWNDTEMDGRIFVDWEPYDHPQLGRVEIGGFIGKLWDTEHQRYTNLMTLPHPFYFDLLEKHTQWNLYLIAMSPFVRITDVKVAPGEAGYFKVSASIQNQGFLPSNVTQQAVNNGTAKTVKAVIALTGAELAAGSEAIDLGHLPGNRSEPVTVEWMVRATGKKPAEAVIRSVSEKGGTDTRKVSLTSKKNP